MLIRRDVLLGLSTLIAPAATSKPTDQSTLNRFFKEGLYLPRRDWLRSQELTPNGAQPWLEQYAQWLAMTGDESGAWRERRLAFGMRPITPPPDVSNLKAQDAVETIVRASRTRQVVTINDEHSTSLTRAFAHQLARRLGSEGFTVFAAETFMSEPNPEQTAMFERHGAMTAGIGFYSGDPVYAEMLRDLRDLGWKFVAYEARPTQTHFIGTTGNALNDFASREEAQARNLAAYIQAHPRDRVLVFCGEGHAYRRSYKGDDLMGRRLNRLGVDPLVVDQTAGLPAPQGDDNDPFLSAVLEKFKPSAPIALFGPDNMAFTKTQEQHGAIDIAVYHPDYSRVAGRPGWLAAAPGRNRKTVQLASWPPQGALVQAVPQVEAGRAANTIPSDQYPIEARAAEASLFLRPGLYDLRIESETGRKILSTIVI